MVSCTIFHKKMGRNTVDQSHSYLNIMVSKSKGYSMMPVVGALALRTSCSFGMNEGLDTLSKSSK